MPDNSNDFYGSGYFHGNEENNSSDFKPYENTDGFSQSQEQNEEVVFTPENAVLDNAPVVNNNSNVYENNLDNSAYFNPYQSPVSDFSKPAGYENQYNSGEFEWQGNTPKQTNASYGYQNSNPMPSNDTRNNRRLPLAVIILICMAVSVIFGSGSAVFVNYYLDDKGFSDEIPIFEKENNKITNTSPLTTELSTSTIVEKYADSVVEIITEYVKTGVFSQQYIESGAGSGVIIDSKGYIVTNHHVIEGAERISVTLRDGTTYQAQLMGSDSKMDLALLKVEADNLLTAVLGDSDDLKVGQRTIAIGNPLGQLGGTVTEGIISALDRNVTVDGQTMNLLQTDTAINPGNSGGGLFDGNGNLIGIVVAKSSGSEVEGLGFAIPINDAVDVVSDLIDYGYVRGRISIGMEFIDVNSEPVAWMYGLNKLGCYVYSVDEDSNAETAGFKSGDLITKVDGVSVKSSGDIKSQLEKKTVGDIVSFTIERGRSKGTLSLELEEYVPKDAKDDYFLQWHYD